MSVGLDTSAAAELLLNRDGSETVADFLDGMVEGSPCSSALLETELRRLADRAEVPQHTVSDALAGVALIEPGQSQFWEAGLLPGRTLRSLDALHLATAIRLDAVVLVAYDTRLLEAAVKFGLEVRSRR